VGRRRLHPALLVHTVRIDGRRRLVAQASAARPPLFLNDPLALSALGALPAEFDRESAGDAWRAAGIGEADHDELWTGFDEAGLFEIPAADGGSWWDGLGWTEARAYHDATRDYPFLQMDQPGALSSDGERMAEYRAEAAAPAAYQHLGDEARIPLPGMSEDEPPDEWLGRLNADERLGLDGLGLLFDICFGERGQMTVAGELNCLLKSIPSGGARHPTEVFLASFDLQGIEPGVYHYDVEGHQLECTSTGQQRAAFADATLDLFGRYDTPPAAALVFTSRVERSMWRYRDPRSYRAILVDVGHAVMAYRLVARMLGFRTFAYQKMRDSQVAELLGVDRIAQPPLYVGTLVP
jgi:SagB-type dehydrogenase family enzyme